MRSIKHQTMPFQKHHLWGHGKEFEMRLGVRRHTIPHYRTQRTSIWDHTTSIMKSLNISFDQHSSPFTHAQVRQSQIKTDKTRISAAAKGECARATI